MTPVKRKSKAFQCVSALFDPQQPSTCDLYRTCKSPYMAISGDLDSEVLIIGEAPGEEEDIQGKQFVGDSGKLLRHALKLAGVTKFALTNAVRCRPPHNRDPKTAEIKTCRPFLTNDMANMPNLKLIVLAGNHAMFSILNHKGVLEHSGTYRTLTIDGKDYGILCVMHPSYVLQNQTELNRFLNHIGRIPNAVTGSLVDASDKGNYITITTLDQLNGLIFEIREVGSFVYDLETTTLDPYGSGLISAISFSLRPREAYVIDMLQHSPWVLPRIKSIMEDTSIGKIGQNIKFDNLWLKVKGGIDVKGTVWDTSYAQYLLDENESHGLKSMAWKYTKLGGYEDLVRGEAHLASGTKLLEYSAIDSDITRRLVDIHKPEIEADPGLKNVMNTILLPVTNVLGDMERRGLRIDLVKLQDCKKEVDKQLQSLYVQLRQNKSVKKFEKKAGKIFNPRSADQLREILFDIEGLKSIKSTAKTKKFSTDREVLEYYQDTSPICNLLVETSVYNSMKSKMIKELEEFTVGGRIHTHFWVTETSTGRSSSDDPNLQNVTKGKKDVVGIRKVFIADEGFKLVEIDYNQHELRCMAELAEDDALYNAVRSGDAHSATAGAILCKDPKLVTEDERRDIGKTFNFGFIYGLTKYGIVKRLHCSDAVAQDYLDRFFGTYFKTKLYMDATTWFVKHKGYVKSKTGRYRRFPIWNDLDEKSIREAINMPVQSLAGDILLYSLIGIDNFLKERKAASYLCLEIHDSLILNMHQSELDLLPDIKHIMLNHFRKHIDFKYELAVDCKIGDNWGELQKIAI